MTKTVQNNMSNTQSRAKKSRKMQVLNQVGLSNTSDNQIDSNFRRNIIIILLQP